jgi:hypothetical protein
VRLGCGIAATMTANLAAGIGHGMPGVVIAAWPAAALVFSYELLLWLVRASANQPEPHPPTSQDAALAAYRTSVATRRCQRPRWRHAMASADARRAES